jgi:hypothetical protein
LYEKKEILEFVKNFKKFHDVKASTIENVFMNGNCYYFAIILKHRFGGSIWYLPTANHFVWKYDGVFYDVTGEAKINEQPVEWFIYEMVEPSASKRIERDCIFLQTR